MFPAKFAVFVEREFFLHLFLIPLRDNGNFLALAAPHFRHIFFDDTHNFSDKNLSRVPS